MKLFRHKAAGVAMFKIMWYLEHSTTMLPDTTFTLHTHGIGYWAPTSMPAQHSIPHMTASTAATGITDLCGTVCERKTKLLDPSTQTLLNFIQTRRTTAPPLAHELCLRQTAGYLILRVIDEKGVHETKTIMPLSSATFMPNIMHRVKQVWNMHHMTF